MRNKYVIIVTAVAVAFISGCSDSSVAPSESPRALHATSRSSFDVQSASGMEAGQTESFDFTVAPSGGTISVGGLATLVFPANSVCDPSVSTYGSDHWEEGCTTIAAPLTVRVTYGYVNGTLGFDFTPAMRFAPSATVTIYTDIFARQIVENREYYKTHKAELNKLALYYSSSLGGARNQDWLADKSVKTKVDLNTGRVSRRIKHFSGYSIITGEPCDPSPEDPDCVDMGDG